MAMQLSIWSYRGHRFAAVTWCVLPGPRTSTVCETALRCISEKAKQSSARNNAKCSKCIQFLCNNSDRTWFFNALTFARSLGRCWKPWPPASVFNTPLGTWWTLMHENHVWSLYWDNGRMTKKGCVQWSAIELWAEFCLQRNSNLGSHDPVRSSITTLPPEHLFIDMLKLVSRSSHIPHASATFLWNVFGIGDRIIYPNNKSKVNWKPRQ